MGQLAYPKLGRMGPLAYPKPGRIRPIAYLKPGRMGQLAYPKLGISPAITPRVLSLYLACAFMLGLYADRSNLLNTRVVEFMIVDVGILELAIVESEVR